MNHGKQLAKHLEYDIYYEDPSIRYGSILRFEILMIFFKILKKLAEFALKFEKSIFLSPVRENLKGKKKHEYE